MKKKFKEEIRPEEQDGIELTDEQMSVVSGGSAQDYGNTDKNDNSNTASGGGTDAPMPQTRDHILL